MIKTESKVIDEIQFTTTQFPAMKSFTLLGKLAKVVGPALGALTGVDASTDLMDLGPTLGVALANLDPDAAAALVVEVLACTTALVQNESGQRSVALNTRENIDLVFSSRLRTMFQAIGFAIGVNYRDFSGGSAPAAPSTPKLSGA